MNKGTMKDAQKIFYKILNGEIGKKEGLDSILKIASKKIIKGYYFGVRGLLTKQETDNYSLKFKELRLKDINYLLNKFEHYVNFKFTNEFDKGYFYACIDYLKYLKESRNMKKI